MPAAPQAEPRRARVEVDLGALTRNLLRLRERVAPAGVLAVVKAQAYGHGAAPVAAALEAAGVDWLGVARVEEGTELRSAGVKAPILLLGPVDRSDVGTAADHGLVPAISSLDQLRSWCDVARSGPIHLKLDTGMHRLGLPESDWGAAADLLSEAGAPRVAGLLSHLAETTAPASARNPVQLACFERAVARFAELIDDTCLLHVSSSASALHLPAARHRLVRAGLALYGIDPAGIDDSLEPVMAVKGPVVHIVDVAAGENVGYGGSWTAARRSRIGIVPIGYGDGYPWRLGGRARVRVGGVDAPVVGQINMDMIQVDLTEVEAEVGSEATLLAGAGDEGPPATELADRAGTSVYEVLCRFGIRLPRIYLDLPTAEAVAGVEADEVATGRTT